MTDAGMAVHLIGQGIKEPRFFIRFPIMLAAEIQYFVLEGFVAVPAMARQNAAIAKDLGALVNSNDAYVVWTIAKLPCAIHGTDRNPGKILVRHI
jgi:hypothetical protein